MAFNVASPDTKQIPLGVFAGLVTNISPTDLPMGASPDCSDNVFLPGGVSTRPCLKKIFATPFGAATVTYAKSYVDPKGIIRNLYLDSVGNIWVENISTAPGVYTLLSTTTPGTYGKSVTAFGREYIAISDGLHGQEVPLQYDGTYLDRVTQDGPGSPPSIQSVALPSSNIGLITRADNLVTVAVESPHGLKVGYQAQVSGFSASPTLQVGGGVASITINNETNPGIALVTTFGAHGLTPGNSVSITGVYAAIAGGSISTASRASGVTAITTVVAHGLVPGALVQLLGITDGSFNGTYTVTQVTSATVFFVYQVNTTDATTSGGTAYLVWPIPDSGTPNAFEVVSAPSATSFQIALNYVDGTWTTGIITFSWFGTFFVNSIIDSETFTYQQYGPDGSTIAAGIVTPFGQAAPGQHQLQVLFLTRQGYTTAPSPPVKFIANGGQYLAVSNIAIGPSNVVARILAFTGAEGAYFFYIPATPEVNGQIVGTATQVNDNTTTAITLDFGDNTLFNALAINIPGNNLPNEIVLDGALGFGFYGSRLFTYGQRNRIQNLLNMGFDGGYLPSASTIPTGWNPFAGSPGGTLVNGHFGQGWQITITAGGTFCGLLSQSFFEDYSGAPIGQGNAKYRLRAWVKANGPVGDAVLFVTISSVMTGFVSGANVTMISTVGNWVELALDNPMPTQIPSDMILSVYAAATTAGGVTITVDELSIIYDDTPYLTGMYASYVDNPEGFDGVSGVIGPVDDTHSVLDVGILRGSLYMLTQDPSGRLHETGQGNTEPSGWTVNEVAANCGTVSAFAMTRSQSDDASAAGGEEWFAWFSSTGIRIFGGYEPDKISQEIQRPVGTIFPGAPPDLGALNAAAQTTVWGLNDPEQKIMWFGIPTGATTAPEIVYTVSYLGLDSAAAIAGAAPVHRSLSGKMVANDLSRKWSPWQLALNGGALMYRDPFSIVPVFFAGNGQFPRADGFGNVYILDAGKYTDDDYGQMAPYYVTYAFPDRDQEQQEQLGGFMKMVAYTGTYIAGYGLLTISVYQNNLVNVWPLSGGGYALQANPPNDTEWSGAQAIAQRFFFKFTVAPNPAGSTAHPLTDVAFSLTSFVAALKPNKRMPVRGAYP